MNALAAIAMANEYGVPLNEIKQSISTFKGVERRFTFKVKSATVVLIDDYAHHPTEINAIESSVRAMYPTEKVLAVFQPHLFSRTSDFMEEFAAVLSKFDEVILLDIYPAREQPIEGVSAEVLLDKITIENKKRCSKKTLTQEIKNSEAYIKIMLGAGDIGAMVNEVAMELKKQAV